jgi:membrane associated rhomboid family serine protease
MGFGPPVTPTIVKQLLIANAAVFVAQMLFAQSGLTEYLAIQPARVWQGGYLWQPFTYMWLHGGLGHLAMNCFVLWMFGSQLALAWGTRRFLRFYLICGVGAGFIIASWPYLAVVLGLASPLTLVYSTVGASGAIYGVLLAYSLTWPDRTIMLIFPPVAFFMAIFLDPRGNVSHIGHLGGVLVGWLYLRRSGTAGKILSWNQLKHRWRRYRMRQKLRAVRYEEHEARRRRRDSDDQTLH